MPKENSAPESPVAILPPLEVMPIYSARIKKFIVWRGVFLLVIILGLFAWLAARLVDLQYRQHSEFATLNQHYLTSKIDAVFRRGAIIDARGRPLALSFSRRDCALDPQIIQQKNGDIFTVLNQLRTALKLTPAEYDSAITAAQMPGKRFVRVKRFLSDAETAAVEKLRLSGVFLPVSYKRHYPQHTTAAAVLGFTNIDGYGLEGIELFADTLLRGEKFSQDAERDALGRKLLDRWESPAAELLPLSVELTLDSYIQNIAEDELSKAVEKFQAKCGYALVLNPRGDILAMAGFPTFDANAPAAAPQENHLLPAIATAYEPGSIFKPFVVARALDEKVITPDSKFFCENGAWKMPGMTRVLHDTHSYGWLTTAGVLIKSSNIGVAKIAAQLGMEKLHRAILDFGFNQLTGIPLAGEIGGKVFPFEKWTSFSRGSIPMGQELTATPLQIALAWCAIANGGELYKPRLFNALKNDDGETIATIPSQTVRRVITPETAKILREILRETVNSGTGKQAKSVLYNLGGKTGTAQQAVNAAERARGLTGYSPNRYISSFVAIAPITDPQLVILVSIVEPSNGKSIYGGTVAAPTVRDIADRILQYQKVPVKK